MNKKGAIEIQFNWIYIAVVGGILLLVFAGIAGSIRKSASEGLEYTAINYLDEIFTGVHGSENTEHTISLSGLEIQVESNPGVCYGYTIGKSRMSTEFMPLFSPNLLKKNVLSHTLGWNMPFRASYFLYLTSPDVAYVFENDLSSLSSNMPSKMTKKQYSGFTNQNYYKIRYLFKGDFPTLHNSVARLPDRDVSAIKIEPSGNIYDGGKIIFYQKHGSSFVAQKTMPYTDKATLFAAIYSENAEVYECNIGKAVKRLNMIASVLKARTEKIKDSSFVTFCTTNPMCKCSSDLYDDAIGRLTALETATSNFNINDLGSVNDAKNALASINDNLNKMACPTIY
jgi:hypothetical protein